MAQLEALLFIASHEEVEWHTPAEVSDALRSEQTLIAEALHHLCVSGLLTTDTTVSDGSIQYRFAPQNDALRKQTDTLATLYRERRHSLLSVIYARPTIDGESS